MLISQHYSLKAENHGRLLLIYVVVTAVFIAIFMLLPRYGPHAISRLTCPKCKKQFNYHWVPEPASFPFTVETHGDFIAPTATQYQHLT